MEQFLIDWEGPVLLWIQEHMRNDFLTPVLTFLTHLGDHGYFWIALTVLFFLLKKTRKVGGLMIWLKLVVSLLPSITEEAFHSEEELIIHLDTTTLEIMRWLTINVD